MSTMMRSGWGDAVELRAEDEDELVATFGDNCAGDVFLLSEVVDMVLPAGEREIEHYLARKATYQRRKSPYPFSSSHEQCKTISQPYGRFLTQVRWVEYFGYDNFQMFVRVKPGLCVIRKCVRTV
jgi:hypothetical protein